MKIREHLLRLKAGGYRYLYFGEDDPGNVWAVDMCWPGDDVVSIDKAIEQGESALRGRSLHAA